MTSFACFVDFSILRLSWLDVDLSSANLKSLTVITYFLQSLLLVKKYKKYKYFTCNEVHF